MPIEVRELIIKAAVVQEGTPTGASADKTNNSVSSAEEIIRLCVEKVLEIIKDKTDR